MVVIASVASFAGCSSASTAPNSQVEHRLPTDGWKPGDSAFMAAFFGRFHATLTPSGACAWMYTPNRGIVYLWPAGYRVRFDPIELLNPSGKVVAHQGQEVNAGGGAYSKEAEASLSPSPAIPDYCGTASRVFLIESPVAAGHGPQ
jgi:hypothetical protein